MGLFVNPPFALFCLEDFAVEIIDDILQKAHDGSTVDAWFYYLATDDYASAPHKKPEGGGQDGTAAPVDKSFKSPFVGRSVTDVAAWLKRKPEGIDLESRFFAVLDKKARDGSVVLCKIGDSDDKGDKVTCVLRDADESSLTLAGIEWGDWEDLLSDGGEYTPEV